MATKTAPANSSPSKFPSNLLAFPASFATFLNFISLLYYCYYFYFYCYNNNNNNNNNYYYYYYYFYFQSLSFLPFSFLSPEAYFHRC